MFKIKLLYSKSLAMSAFSVKIGIIGGTGLEDPDILQDKQEKTVKTPYGQPSDVLITGKISGVPCVLLSRHGRKHDQSPTTLPYRANIWALKEEGCTHILATTACGSLQEHIAPGHIVIIDQFVDRTYKRHQTFYDGESHSPKGVCHLPMEKPYCPHTREIVIGCAKELGLILHEKGTMVVIEGPRFSTKAESKLFKSWGGDVIGMTSVPETVLAREMGIFYCAIALPTDYDCWRDHGESVTVSAVMETFSKNREKAINIIKKAVPKIAAQDWAKESADMKAVVKEAMML